MGRASWDWRSAGVAVAPSYGILEKRLA